MLGKPKYKYGDKVSFKIENETINGIVYIIDKYGTFEDNTDVSYDIMVIYKGRETLFKHIKETFIID